VAAAAILTAFAAPSEALAQSGRHLDITLQARAQYDSNVARESKAAADAAGVRTDDIRYSLMTAIDGGMNVGRQAVFLRGTVGYDFYQYNKDLKKARVDLKGGTAGRLGPCQAVLNAAYRRVLAELAPLSTTDARNSTENVLSYGGSASCPIIGPIGGTLSVQRSEIKTDGARTFRDSNSTVVAGNIGYNSQTLGSIGVIGSYTRTDYGTPPVAIPNAFNATGFDSYSVGLQYTRPIGTRLTGSASVSYFELHRDDPAVTQALTGGGTSGTSWNVGFGYRASNRLNMDIAFSDSTGATTRIGSAYQREQRASGEVHYQFSRKLDGSLNVDQTFRRFAGGAGNAFGQASKQRRLRYGANLGYGLGRNIHLGLDAAHEDIHTDIDTLNYTVNRFGATVSYKF